MNTFAIIQTIDQSLEQFAHLEKYLPIEEINRINRHSHSRAKDESLAIRLQLLGLCEKLNLSLEPYPVHYLASGKPVLKTSGFFMSWSHSKGVAASIISDCAVGIDVEADRPIHPGLYRKSLAPQEMNEIIQLNEYQQKEVFLKKWVIKEAFLKMAGLGIAHHITKVSVMQDGSKVEYEHPNGNRSQYSSIFYQFNDQEWFHSAVVAEREIEIRFI